MSDHEVDDLAEELRKLTVEERLKECEKNNRVAFLRQILKQNDNLKDQKWEHVQVTVSYSCIVQLYKKIIFS